LHTTGYERYGICGEVYLWGTVVEHEQGFRAQFAYPKNLYLPPKMLPSTLAEMQARLQALTLYGSDIFVLGNGETISLWAKDSGYTPAGLDYLIERSKRYYDRRQRDRTLKKGDRVAVLGRGIAVVERVDDKQVQVMLWNKLTLRIVRSEIHWDQQNRRWETDANAAFERLVQPPQ
jgi:preprotein translocase subunit YajC